ncbi:Hypothetical Protein PD5205_00219 [Xanthomonas fragariae]|uniref:Uncharacterized protein n=1 Tax=Xanthomonas fragariae TaxID=48664 RepID=A0A1Y6HGZ3_9XANT|nr:hypothetical protein PD885_03795 [Xanthomonas fragariae]SMR01540.1 Hypothetical Protein PD5205_00219 [Xanthomonas fragariae]
MDSVCLDGRSTGSGHLPLHRSHRRAYGAEHAVPQRHAAAKEADDRASVGAIRAGWIECATACACGNSCAAAPCSASCDACGGFAGDSSASSSDATGHELHIPLPPPPLFECTAHDNGRYLTEDREPATRCLPMQTTNLAGGPAIGGGSACEVVTDRCAPVPDQSLCEAWRKRAEQAEATWHFSDETQSAERKRRYEQMRRVLDESRCANPSATP